MARPRLIFPIGDADAVEAFMRGLGTSSAVIERRKGHAVLTLPMSHQTPREIRCLLDRSDPDSRDVPFADRSVKRLQELLTLARSFERLGVAPDSVVVTHEDEEIDETASPQDILARSGRRVHRFEDYQRVADRYGARSRRTRSGGRLSRRGRD